MKYIFELENLHCANCAGKIQDKLNKQEYIEGAELNFMLKKLMIEIKDEYDINESDLIENISGIADSIEDGVKIVPRNKSKTLQRELMTSNPEAKDTTKEHVHKKTQGDTHKKIKGKIHTNTRGDVNKKHEEHNKANSKNNCKNTKIIESAITILGLILLVGAVILDIDYLFVISYIALGYDVVYKAFRNIIKANFLDENFLMTIATLAAFVIGEHPEAVAVMVFYKVGEYFQDRAVNHSQKEIAKAMDIRPEFARLIVEGKVKTVNPDEVEVGDIIEVRVGEKIPLDGEVIEGTTNLDTAMLTGESLPVTVNKGSKVLSGSINNSSVIKVRVTEIFADSTVSKILELIQSASSKKAKSEKFITKFARIYTPVVVLVAVLIGVIPSLTTGNWGQWIYTSILFLVISCPCALVVSIPLGFFAGIGASARMGVLIKGGNYLEALNEVKVIVLDKTGTITKGEFGVSSIVSTTQSEDELLKLAAKIEIKSNHPIAGSIVRRYKEVSSEEVVAIDGQYREQSGEGVVVNSGDDIYIAGNTKLMDGYNINYVKSDEIGSHIYIAKNNEYMGHIVVRDEIKQTSIQAIKRLKETGIEKVIMLTGDQEKNAIQVAEKVGVDEVHAGLLPHQKVINLEEILKTNKAAFVGDGINDAPVLARADIGIAMGGAGSDAAIEAADIVLMTDDLMSIAKVKEVASRTKRVIMQNIVFSLGTKIIVMILGILGMANMWLAIFADVGVSLIAILNSIRILRSKNKSNTSL